jgi:hypothetical protein
MAPGARGGRSQHGQPAPGQLEAAEETVGHDLEAVALAGNEIAASVEVALPAELRLMVVDGEAAQSSRSGAPTGPQRSSPGDRDRRPPQRGPRTGSRRERPARAPPSCTRGRARRCACPRTARRLRGGRGAASASSSRWSEPPPCGRQRARVPGAIDRRVLRRYEPVEALLYVLRQRRGHRPSSIGTARAGPRLDRCSQRGRKPS